MAEGTIAGHGSSRGTRFALTKFRPPALPDTLISRSVLHDRLDGGSWPAADGCGGVGRGRQERAAGGLGRGAATWHDFVAVL